MNHSEDKGDAAQREKTKIEVSRKVAASPLLRGCAGGAPEYLWALFEGYWLFVDQFPGIIRETYGSTPRDVSDATRRFLRRAAPILSGTLAGMEDDERAHRTLWIESARCAGISETRLSSAPLVPEVRTLTENIGGERDLRRRLLYFVSVEIVAEEMSRFLADAPAFVSIMGEKGMGWFNAHLVHPTGTTTHEEIAYNIVEKLGRANGQSVDGAEINEHIQRAVDWFTSGATGCVREYI